MMDKTKIKTAVTRGRMTIQQKFLLILIFLAILLGAGIIIPSQLEIVKLELREANERIQNNSANLKQEVERRKGVLEKAGVSKIERYIEASKRDLVRQYASVKRDTIWTDIIINFDGGLVFNSAADSELEVTKRLLNELEQLGSNEVINYQINSESWLISAHKIDGWNWYVLSGVSESKVHQNSRKHLRYVLLIGSAVLLFVFWLYAILTRRIRRKVNLILEYLDYYRKGRYDKRIPEFSQDEISVMQEGVNTMIDSIEMEISARKSAEAELQDLKSRAENVSQAKTDTLIRVHQDIQQPMNTILGFSEMLSNADLSNKHSRQARTVLQASQNLVSILNKEVGEVENQENMLVNDVFYLIEDLKELFLTLSTEAKRNGIKLGMTIGDHVPAIVYGNKIQFLQSFNDLTHNAIKHRLGKSIEIGVFLEKEGSAKFVIRVEFSNTNPEAKSNKQSKTNIKQGAVAAIKLIEKLAHSFKTASRVKGGANLKLLVSFNKKIGLDDHAILDFQAFTNLSVLMIDSDPLNQAYITELFHSIGANCVAFERGKEALKHIEESDIDLVLIDLEMPDNESKGVIEAIRYTLPKYLNDMPIIGMTSETNEKECGKDLQLTLQNIIHKPVNTGILLRAVEKIVSIDPH